MGQTRYLLEVYQETSHAITGAPIDRMQKPVRSAAVDSVDQARAEIASFLAAQQQEDATVVLTTETDGTLRTAWRRMALNDSGFARYAVEVKKIQLENVFLHHATVPGNGEFNGWSIERFYEVEGVPGVWPVMVRNLFEVKVSVFPEVYRGYRGRFTGKWDGFVSLELPRDTVPMVFDDCAFDHAFAQTTDVAEMLRQADNFLHSLSGGAPLHLPLVASIDYSTGDFDKSVGLAVRVSFEVPLNPVLLAARGTQHPRLFDEFAERLLNAALNSTAMDEFYATRPVVLAKHPVSCEAANIPLPRFRREDFRIRLCDGGAIVEASCRPY